MSFEDLFPNDATRVIAIQDGTNGRSTVVLSECQRCKAFVFRTLAHARWHASVDHEGLTMTEPRKPDREVLAVARELAKASNAEAVRIMGGDATVWADLTPERRARAIAAMTPLAQLAVDTITSVRIGRLIFHPSLTLVRDQFDKADAKGYTRAHDQEHGARRLIQAGHAYTMCALTRQTRGVTNDGQYLWPFADGWNPGDTPAETLVKAAHLLLSAADVIEHPADAS